jgi:hypothetical protein
MKFLQPTSVFCLSLLLSWQALAADISAEKGYIDFGNLTSVYGEPKVEINLGKAMLGFVGGAAEAEDPEAASLIKNLKSVRVLIYDIVHDADEALKTVDRVTRDIQKDGWETVVSVNEENEKVRIYAKMSGDLIDGLVVMAVDEKRKGNGKSEAVFINIIGQLDPEQVGRVTKRLDINVDVTP